MQTILITGCSSGFGLETARYFLDRGWNVIATMRTPREDVLPPSERLQILALDVTQPDSIQQAIDAAGPIDVLVNNAGAGFMGALEGTPMETIRQLFEANTFGMMAMTQAVLPQFRERKSGIVVNVSSSTTLKALPLLSVYTATKAAVNAFTESLAVELEPFGIRVSLVLPGRAPDTPFSKTAQSKSQGSIPEAYAEIAKNLFVAATDTSALTYASDVAQAIWLAVNDRSAPLRIPAGADAVALSK